MLGLGIMPKVRARWGRLTRQVQTLLRPRVVSLRRREALSVVWTEPHDMTIGDRIVLYGLVRGLKPRAYLEIGVRWGGSARIVSTAMEANGFGKGVGLDPDLSNFLPRESELFGRFSLCKGYSPEDIPAAIETLGSPPDFVFIDAVHTYSAVLSDLKGVLPHVAERAYVLLHDAYHQGVSAAGDEILTEDQRLVDLGILSKNPMVALPNSYCGLRLLRLGDASLAYELTSAHNDAGLPTPELDRANWDKDPYAERRGTPLGR